MAPILFYWGPLMLKKILTLLLTLSFLFSQMTPVFAESTIRYDASQQPSTNNLLDESSFRTLPLGHDTDADAQTEQRESLLRSQTLAGAMSRGLTYQVHVLGEVAKPGTYRVMASDRLSELLARIGGVLPRGSERFIEIRRQEQKKKIVDLFAFERQGNLSDNPYLLENDVVFVPFKKGVVQIVGAVKRPDLYEIKGEKTVQDLVTLVGGFTNSVNNNEPLKIIRFEGDEKKVIEVPNTPEGRSASSFENGDVLVIPDILTAKNHFDYSVKSLPASELFYPSFEDRVFVIGGVFKPGAYKFHPNYHLKQYLAFAGGTTTLAKNSIKIINSSGQKTKAKDTSIINPGDTIVVPERRLPPEAWIGLTATIVSMASSITTMIVLITQ